MDQSSPVMGNVEEKVKEGRHRTQKAGKGKEREVEREGQKGCGRERREGIRSKGSGRKGCEKRHIREQARRTERKQRKGRREEG